MWKIADILGSILGFASKNPIVAKMAIFTKYQKRVCRPSQNQK